MDDSLGTADIEQEPDRSAWVDHPDNPAIYWDSGWSSNGQKYLTRGSSAEDTKPNRVAPHDYDKEYVNPKIKKPIGLISDLRSKFGKSGKMSDYYLTTPDIPSSGTIKLSEFEGFSEKVRIRGKIRIDRWDDIMGGGLFKRPDRTWDDSDSSGLPGTRKNEPAPNWTNAVNNNWYFVYELENDTSRILEVNAFILSHRYHYYTQGSLANSTTCNYFLVGGTSSGDIEDVSDKFSIVAPTSPSNDYISANYSIRYIPTFGPQAGIPTNGNSWYRMNGSNDAERMENLKRCITGGFLFRHNLPTIAWSGTNYHSNIVDTYIDVDLYLSLKSSSTLRDIAKKHLKSKDDSITLEI